MEPPTEDTPQAWVSGLEFEHLTPLRRVLKALVVHPFANYFPSPLLRAVLRLTRSELAAANWVDPGGWRSMVISYHNHAPRLVDRLLVGLGTIPMALRNRRRLVSRVLARLIDRAGHEPVHVLCLGAGPGHNINDALAECAREAHATLVDLSSDAFAHGRDLAMERGTGGRIRFVQGDVVDVAKMLDRPTDVAQMVGICEYLADEQVVAIARTVAEVMDRGAPLVANSLSKAHGTDRFFRRVFDLHMIHRSPGELERLFGSAGFGGFVALPEPLGVYHILIGRRL